MFIAMLSNFLYSLRLLQLYLTYIFLLDEQRRIFFPEIMSVIQSPKKVFFLLYGYDGTDKIFMWNTLSASKHSRKKIILNVASSGIASLLLPEGRTPH